MCDYEKYTRVVKFQNLMMDFELSFKRNPTYMEILEHTDTFGANRYLTQINTEFGNFYNNNKPALVELCQVQYVKWYERVL